MYLTAVLERPFLRHLSDTRGLASGCIACDTSVSYTCPVFAVGYSEKRYQKFVAMGDEDGWVSMVDTKKGLPSALSDSTSVNRPVAQWRQHKNAVFDLKWANDDAWMYTASGDMTIALHDTGYAAYLRSFSKHSMSVKSISVMPNNHNIFVSGGRDGDIGLWDARCYSRGRCDLDFSKYRRIKTPTAWTRSPHAVTIRREVPCRKRRKYDHTNTVHGITSLCFLPCGGCSSFVSAGSDGCIRLWDTRYLAADPVMQHAPLRDPTETFKKELEHKYRLAHGVALSPAASTESVLFGQRSRGISSLAMHPNGSQLVASFQGGHHLMYNTSRLDLGPEKWFGGNFISSFYVKNCFSPDGSHFMSGSSDSKVYIWNTHDPLGTDPIVLQGHSKEVTAVAWCPDDMFQITTAGDDHVVKVWNVDVQQSEEVLQEHNTERLWKSQQRGRDLATSNIYNLNERALHERAPNVQESAASPTRDSLGQHSLVEPETSKTPVQKIKVSNALLESLQKEKPRQKKQATLTEMIRPSRNLERNFAAELA